MTDDVITQLAAARTNPSIIMVVGVGGAGGNAVNHMWNLGIKGVDFMVCNTDQQALDKSPVELKVRLGSEGLGAGNDPENGRKAAIESLDVVRQRFEASGTKMVFITAGMGGGTGTGAAPIVAKVAKQMEILTVAIVTKPFNFEGRKRMAQAEAGINKLREFVDSLIVIPNERLKLLTDKKITFLNAFQEADDVLRKGVQSICELITVEGIINLDFADVSAVMSNAGLAHMGVGSAKGKDKAEQAAKMAMSSPLLETNISGARGIVVNITASPDIGLEEIDSAVAMITDEAQPDATIIFGAAFDASLEDEMRITLIATGFDLDKRPGERRPQSASAAPSATPAASNDLDNGESDLNDIISILNQNRKTY